MSATLTLPDPAELDDTPGALPAAALSRGLVFDEGQTASPLYLRIRDQLRRQIASGTLAPGTRLPSSRQLAVDLGVSRITVTNAYAELEADGLVVSRLGSGTFVAEDCGPGARRDARALIGTLRQPAWQERLVHTDFASGAPIEERERLMRRMHAPPSGQRTVNFGQARGDQRLFPYAELRRIMNRLLHEDAGVLEYEPPEGSLFLRRVLAQYLRQQGVNASPEEIIITAGAQQAFDLLTRAIVAPGDVVVVEEPTFVGALEALETRRARIVGVRHDGDGIDLLGLERAFLQHSPRLVYLVPTFHNPTGAVMSAARRREVVALAQRYGVPVVEDEYLRQVRFGSPIPPPLAAFDSHGNVIHVGSFSKSISPAFRLGYMVVRGALRERLISLKRTTDICCSPILQRAAAEFLECGTIYTHWKRISRVYRRRQAAMLSAVQRHFPAGCTWHPALGGVIVWIRLPDGYSPVRLLEEAQREGVSFAPGAMFYVQPADQPYVRLNYASVNEAEIEQGVAILGRLLRRQVAGRRPNGDALCAG